MQKRTTKKKKNIYATDKHANKEKIQTENGEKKGKKRKRKHQI
jgi:hypothetical protein